MSRPDGDNAVRHNCSRDAVQTENMETGQSRTPVPTIRGHEHQKKSDRRRFLAVVRSFILHNIYQTDSPCKPGSVEGNHLSLYCITAILHVESLRRCATNAAITGNLLSTGVNRIGVASDRVYSRRILLCEWVRSYRTFPP